MKLIFALSLVTIFAATSFVRSSVYKDQVTLWADTVLKSPRKARPHDHLGLALRLAGDFEAAEKHLDVAIAIDPDYVQARNTLATIYRVTGRENRALQLLYQTLEIDPNYLAARYNLALWYYQAGSNDAALREYNRILEINPNSKEAKFAQKMIQLIKEKNQKAR